MPDDAPHIYSARPTVRIDGLELPLLSAAIERMTVREAEGGLSSLELALRDTLSFDDGGAGYGGTAASPLKLGKPIKIHAGTTEEPREIFDGIVTAIEAEAGPHTTPLFTLLAEDRLWKARRRRRSRVFEDRSPADIARTIAQDHGLTPEIRDGLDEPKTLWAQIDESDLSFLRRVLASVDADLQAVGGALQAGPCARDPRSRRSLRLRETLLRVRLTADLADQATETRIGGFDPEPGEAVNASATAGELGPGEGRTGFAILRDIADEVREHTGHRGPLSDGEAAKQARAAFGRRARRFVRVDATAQGDAALRVGSHVTIAGVNPLFENTYAVVEATHRFDTAQGYLTDFIAEGAYLGEPS